MSQEPNAYSLHGYDIGTSDAGRSGTARSAPGRGTSSLRQALWALTGAFGLGAWAVGWAAAVPLGLAVTLGVLAGAVALIGLLPGQVSRGWLAVAVAATAFADAVTTTVTTGEPTWVLIVVDVLVALQAVVAVAALLLEAREPAVTQPAPDDDYTAYVRYVQAYQDYAERYGSWPEHDSTAEVADAAGYAQATGTARSDADAWADMQAKYARHVSPVAPASLERGGRQGDEANPGDAGLPGINRAERSYEAPGPTAPGSAPASPTAY
jgi:hypothetical protein